MLLRHGTENGLDLPIIINGTSTQRPVVEEPVEAEVIRRTESRSASKTPSMELPVRDQGRVAKGAGRSYV